jgi:hypothetical protein
LGVGRKADDLALQNLLLRNPKKWKLHAPWQNIVRMTGCFANDDDDDDDNDIQIQVTAPIKCVPGVVSLGVNW